MRVAFVKVQRPLSLIRKTLWLKAMKKIAKLNKGKYRGGHMKKQTNKMYNIQYLFTICLLAYPSNINTEL